MDSFNRFSWFTFALVVVPNSFTPLWAFPAGTNHKLHQPWWLVPTLSSLFARSALGPTTNMQKGVKELGPTTRAGINQLNRFATLFFRLPILMSHCLSVCLWIIKFGRLVSLVILGRKSNYLICRFLLLCPFLVENLNNSFQEISSYC